MRQRQLVRTISQSCAGEDTSIMEWFTTLGPASFSIRRTTNGFPRRGTFQLLRPSEEEFFQFWQNERLLATDKINGLVFDLVKPEDLALSEAKNNYSYQEIKSKTIGLHQITDIQIYNKSAASKLQTLQLVQVALAGSWSDAGGAHRKHSH